jgi:hypothetical protein
MSPLPPYHTPPEAARPARVVSSKCISYTLASYPHLHFIHSCFIRDLSRLSPRPPPFPSAFPSVLSNRLTVAEYFILATHQPTPSFFPFFLRLSAFVFSKIPFSQYRSIVLLLTTFLQSCLVTVEVVVYLSLRLTSVGGGLIVVSNSTA